MKHVISVHLSIAHTNITFALCIRDKHYFDNNTFPGTLSNSLVVFISFILFNKWNQQTPSYNSKLSLLHNLYQHIRCIIIFMCLTGQLLAALKRLLSNLTHLRTLKLIDLMLERYDAKHLLDEVLNSCCLVLKVLHLVNVTTVHCPIMHIGLFLNLQVCL